MRGRSCRASARDSERTRKGCPPPRPRPPPSSPCGRRRAVSRDGETARMSVRLGAAAGGRGRCVGWEAIRQHPAEGGGRHGVGSPGVRWGYRDPVSVTSRPVTVSGRGSTTRYSASRGVGRPPACVLFLLSVHRSQTMQTQEEQLFIELQLSLFIKLQLSYAYLFSDKRTTTRVDNPLYN